jgi:hypothetical protein
MDQVICPVDSSSSEKKKKNYTSLKNKDKYIRNVKLKPIYSATVAMYGAVHSSIVR